MRVGVTVVGETGTGLFICLLHNMTSFQTASYNTQTKQFHLLHHALCVGSTLQLFFFFQVKKSMDLETSKSVRLRRKLDTGPSEKDILGMRREIEELKLKLAKANNKEVSRLRVTVHIFILCSRKSPYCYTRSDLCFTRFGVFTAGALHFRSKH